MTNTTASNAYDRVPYPGLSYSHTSPDRLATVATLLGMHPTPVDHCRVLELGCAGGGNLIPLAYALPESYFLGIDYSSTQIQSGKEKIQRLGLKNIALEHLNILDVERSLGEFDYIIAHGMFSWVPPAVREKLLSICKENLSPNGVAYVSYNAQPGWWQLGMIREMMLYHVREIDDPQERAAGARFLLDFLAKAVPPESGAYGSLLNMYAGILCGEFKSDNARGNALLLHDELEEINQPFYFYQFIEMAQQHGLQYLGDAEFHTMVSSNFPPSVSETLSHMARDVIELEQYMDFLRDRTFRRTLLCHDYVQLDRVLRPELVRSFYVASNAKPESEPGDLEGVVRFRASSGATLATDHPVTKEAMLYLSEIWPGAVSFEDLFSIARSRLAAAGQDKSDDEATDAYVLSANILQAYSYSDTLIELCTYRPKMTLTVGERPVASPVARMQALEWSKVTNLCHERVDLNELERYLLIHLDGQHSCADLVDLLIAGPLADGRLKIVSGCDDGMSDSKDGQSIRDVLSVDVQKRLQGFALASLLVG